jgi:two-component system, OmpR family, response regulator CpxR
LSAYPLLRKILAPIENLSKVSEVHAVWIAGEIEPLTMTVKKTILCVDDEQSLSIHKVTLETRGYRVLACNTAAEAMNIFAHVAVDLVLSSVDLPDAPSPELVGHIKARSADIPVVLLSSHKRVFHTDAPVDLLLRKGTYAPAELLERIRLLLVKRRGPRRAASPSAAVERRFPAC